MTSSGVVAIPVSTRSDRSSRSRYCANGAAPGCSRCDRCQGRPLAPSSGIPQGKDHHELSERLILTLLASVDLRGYHHHHLTLVDGRTKLTAHYMPVAVRADLDRGLVDPLEVMNASHWLALPHEGSDRHERLADAADGSSDVAVDVGGRDHPLTIETRWREIDG